MTKILNQIIFCSSTTQKTPNKEKEEKHIKPRNHQKPGVNQCLFPKSIGKIEKHSQSIYSTNIVNYLHSFM